MTLPTDGDHPDRDALRKAVYDRVANEIDKAFWGDLPGPFTTVADPHHSGESIWKAIEDAAKHLETLNQLPDWLEQNIDRQVALMVDIGYQASDIDYIALLTPITEETLRYSICPLTKLPQTRWRIGESKYGPVMVVLQEHVQDCCIVPMMKKGILPAFKPKPIFNQIPYQK